MKLLFLPSIHLEYHQHYLLGSGILGSPSLYTVHPFGIPSYSVFILEKSAFLFFIKVPFDGIPYTHSFKLVAFIPNPENKPCIDHINTDKMDNTVWLNEDGSVNYEKTNLRWVTKKENMNNPLTIKDLSKIRIGNENAKSIYRAVLQYTKDGKLIKEWASMNSAAKELKINRSGIHSCCNGRNRCKSYGGYVWRYKN